MMQGISYRQLYWEAVREGDCLPTVTMEVPYKKIILNAAATWDYFPGHHNPYYAQEQGQKTIYMSTLFFNGFIDRVITDWAGPQTFIARRKMSMQRSIYAGDTMSGTGRITRTYTDDQGRHLVDLEIMISNQDGPSCPASATIVLPSRKSAGGKECAPVSSQYA